MPIFKILAVYSCLIFPAFILVWINQESFNAYWQQQFHQESPLQKYLSFKGFLEGQKVCQNLNHLLVAFKIENRILRDFDNKKTPTPKIDEILPNSTENKKEESNLVDISVKPPSIKENVNKNIPKTDKTKLKKEKIEKKFVEEKKEEDIKVKVENTVSLQSPILLTSQDTVFFAGDSLMQGVAPHVQKMLRKKYNIKSINLSKQSTGLVYPRFFDWPKTIEETLKNSPQIKVLVMMLGANDTWDIQFPRGRNRFKYQTLEWENEYKARIDRILKAARENNVTVLWLGIPYMKRQVLNKQMRYLEDLLINHLRNKVVFVPVKHLLHDPEAEKYQIDMLINNKRQRVRSKDGVHFTFLGQKILANEILKHLQVKEHDQANH